MFCTVHIGMIFRDIATGMRFPDPTGAPKNNCSDIRHGPYSGLVQNASGLLVL